MYEYGQTSSAFNGKTFISGIFLSIYHSIICYYFPVYFLEGSSIEANGGISGQWISGTSSFCCVILVVTLHMMLEVSTFNVYVKVVTVVSLVLYFMSVFILCYPSIGTIFQPEVVGIIYLLFGNARFFFTMILVSIFALLPEYTYIYIKRTYYPKALDIAVEIQAKSPKIGNLESAKAP